MHICRQWKKKRLQTLYLCVIFQHCPYTDYTALNEEYSSICPQCLQKTMKTLVTQHMSQPRIKRIPPEYESRALPPCQSILLQHVAGKSSLKKIMLWDNQLFTLLGHEI